MNSGFDPHWMLPTFVLGLRLENRYMYHVFYIRYANSTVYMRDAGKKDEIKKLFEHKAREKETTYYAYNRKPTVLSRLILAPITVSYTMMSLSTSSMSALLVTRTETSSAEVVYLAEVVAPDIIVRVESDSPLTFAGKSPTQECKANAKSDNFDESTETTRKALIYINSYAQASGHFDLRS